MGVLDSQAILNANNYFGSSNWQFLDRVDTSGDRSNRDYWRVVGALRGLPQGGFTLATGIWDQYWKLAVALKGPGAYAQDNTGTEVNWSLYMLPRGTNLYEWVYGATRSGVLRNLFAITLYGMTRPTSIAEPLTVFLMLTGVAGVVLLARRRDRGAIAIRG
ncbi:MAG: hypothetical protein FJ197_07530 [Gammaproteobacteria bacterium]|nr:hypothetical protein [Gammaproteobacteria bacterium]